MFAYYYLLFLPMFVAVFLAHSRFFLRSLRFAASAPLLQRERGAAFFDGVRLFFAQR